MEHKDSAAEGHRRTKSLLFSVKAAISPTSSKAGGASSSRHDDAVSSKSSVPRFDMNPEFIPERGTRMMKDSGRRKSAGTLTRDSRGQINAGPTPLKRSNSHKLEKSSEVSVEVSDSNISIGSGGSSAEIPKIIAVDVSPKLPSITVINDKNTLVNHEEASPIQLRRQVDKKSNPDSSSPAKKRRASLLTVDEVPPPRFSDFDGRLKKAAIETSLSKDLPRFVPKLTLRDGDKVSWNADDHASEPLPSQIVSVLKLLQKYTNKKDIDFSSLERKEGDLEEALQAFIEKLSDDEPFSVALKAIFNQGIVAPLWLWLKMNLLVEFPFKDVSLGWHIDCLNLDDHLVVTHHKQERSRITLKGESGEPAFSFQWNLQLSVDKVAVKMDNFRFWISHFTYKTGDEFSFDDVDRLKSLLDPWIAAGGISLKLSSPHRVQIDPKAFEVEKEVAETDLYYRGWVSFKTGKNYETCWLAFRESSTFITLFTNDPKQDPVSCRAIGFIDLRNASVKLKQESKKYLCEIITQGKKVHKFCFDVEDGANLFVTAINQSIEFAVQAAAAIELVKSNINASAYKTEASPLTDPKSGTKSALESNITVLDNSKGLKAARFSASHSSSSTNSSGNQELGLMKASSLPDRNKDKPKPLDPVKEKATKSNPSVQNLINFTPASPQGSMSVDMANSSAINSSNSLQVPSNSPPSAVSPNGRRSSGDKKKKGILFAQSSSTDISKFLRFRSQLKTKDSEFFDFPIHDENQRKRSIVAYVLKDFGNLAGQFAISALLRRDRSFLTHKGMHTVVIGSGAIQILTDSSQFTENISSSSIYSDHSSHLIDYLFSKTSSNSLDEIVAGVFLVNETKGVVYSFPISMFLNLPPSDVFIQEVNRFIYENPRMNWSQLSQPLISWAELQKDNSASRLIDAPPSLFTCEFGTNVSYQPSLKIEEEIHFYEEVLAELEHSHFVAVLPNFGPIVLTIEERVNEPRALIWTKKGISNHVVPASVKNGAKSAVVTYLVEKIIYGFHDRLKHMDLLECRLAFKRVKNTQFNQKLIEIHNKIASNKFKIGVLFAPEGKISEKDLYSTESNLALDPELEEFLNMLGDKIELQGWFKFRGGLDVKSGLTGTHSYYTNISDHEVMFHVCPLITQQNVDDPSRKRYIGNDIVVIVYKKSSGDVFYPADMSSQFNHIYMVVEKDKNLSASGKPRYRINIANKASVPTYPPYLPSPPVFEAGPELRTYILTKLLNGERAAISRAKMFSTGNAKTLDSLLTEAINEISPQS